MKKATRDSSAENIGTSLGPLSDQGLANPPHITNLFNIPIDFYEFPERLTALTRVR